MARSTAPTAPLRERMAETVTTKEPVAVHLLLLPPLRAPSLAGPLFLRLHGRVIGTREQCPVVVQQ